MQKVQIITVMQKRIKKEKICVFLTDLMIWLNVASFYSSRNFAIIKKIENIFKEGFRNFFIHCKIILKLY